MKTQINIDVQDRLHYLGKAEAGVLELAQEIRAELKSALAASDIATLYVRALSAQRQLEPLVSELNELMDQLKTISVPELFEASKSTSHTTLGYRVTISAKMRSSIRAAAKEVAFDWLRKNGGGDIIKVEPTVHPVTMDSWGRQHVADGGELPEELFSTYYFNTTSVTKANKK